MKTVSISISLMTPDKLMHCILSHVYRTDVSSTDGGSIVDLVAAPSLTC